MITLKQKQYNRAFEKSLKGLSEREIKMLKLARDGRARKLRELRLEQEFVRKLFPNALKTTEERTSQSVVADLKKRKALLRLAGIDKNNIKAALNQKTYSEENSGNNNAAKKAGMIGASLGVGLVGGYGAHKLAKDSSEIVDKSRRYISTSISNRAHKIADKSGKTGAERKAIVNNYRNPKLAKLRNASDKVKSVTDKVSKFAKTKGGKWAIIGGTTAALGGAAYLEAKKER